MASSLRPCTEMAENCRLSAIHTQVSDFLRGQSRDGEMRLGIEDASFHEPMSKFCAFRYDRDPGSFVFAWQSTLSA